MEAPLRILLLEDEPHDVELIRASLDKDGLISKLFHCTDEATFNKVLECESVDLILSDYHLPTFNGLEALEIRKKKCPLTPFILVSGRMGEEIAIEALKNGATDYVLKDKISRLPMVIRRALHEKEQQLQIKRDQEALQVSEQKYRTLFENSRDAIYITDARGDFIDINQSAVELFGFGLDEMLKMNLLDLYADRAEGLDFIKSLEKKGAVRNQEQTLKRKDGKRLDCLLSSTLRWSNDLCILGQQGIIHNFTERKDIEKAMFDAQKLESLGVLAGGIAHDFNNLLAVIQGNAELATRAIPQGSNSYKFLEQIDKASQRSGELCKQLLSYAGKGKLVMQAIDLNSLIQETSQLLQISVSKCSLIKYSLLKSLPLVTGDATQLRQVILNLVINASEAIGEGQGIITLSTGVIHATRRDLLETKFGTDYQEGDYVYFEVTDTGSGMDAKTIDRIFDPFFTTKFTGRGLGLAAVLGIIRSHKGTLKVTSEKERGTVFRILLPPSHTTHEVSTNSCLAPKKWSSSGLVLVVDDEESVRLMVTQMLQTFGFEVVQACDGHEAIEIFNKRNHEVVLVLLDMTMPQISGAKVCKELYLSKPDTKVLLMSGYDAEHANNLFLGDRIPGFIQKPFKMVTLMEKVQAILSGKDPVKFGI